MTDRDLRFVEKLADNLLECRAGRHFFRRNYFGPLRGLGEEFPYSPSVIVRKSFCEECESFRYEFFNTPQGDRAMRGFSFVPFARRYVYHPDYLWKGDESSKEKPYAGDYKYELYLRARRENGRI